ncbi:Crp/Fnr family transcriptional regulator [Chryseobacterium sp. CP-77]|uniref:Crp/Fnr family transcriptional regulator n=1 Tax=Chryseobacterium sp. CP-77 TaxID=3116594 RepID=UPI002ECFBADF
MIISKDLLFSYGAICQNYNSKDVIFSEGAVPLFYYQIVHGTVELNNYLDDGKEFTHNIVSDGQSFGESLLFIDQPYPMNGIAREDCEIIKLPKEDFKKLLNENNDVMLEIFHLLSSRLFHKYMMLLTMSSTDPQVKIKNILEFLKSTQSKLQGSKCIIPYTRQQIANLTGLRVETVIRSIKKMAEQGLLQLDGRKIVI